MGYGSPGQERQGLAESLSLFRALLLALHLGMSLLIWASFLNPGLPSPVPAELVQGLAHGGPSANHQPPRGQDLTCSKSHIPWGGHGMKL